MATSTALNQFIVVDGAQLFPTPDNVYQVAWYRIGADQLMLVRGRISDARYYGISLCNAWLETFDYTRHQVNLNHGRLVTDADGRFEVCLSHSDVGHPNWLDTAGHLAGILLVRSLLLQGDPHPLELEVLYVARVPGRPPRDRSALGVVRQIDHPGVGCGEGHQIDPRRAAVEDGGISGGREAGVVLEDAVGGRAPPPRPSRCLDAGAVAPPGARCSTPAHPGTRSRCARPVSAMATPAMARSVCSARRQVPCTPATSRSAPSRPRSRAPAAQAALGADQHVEAIDGDVLVGGIGAA